MSTTVQLATRQRGLSFLSLIVIIGLVSFFGAILFKVGPLYSGFWTVRTIMEDIVESPDMKKDSNNARTILTSIEKRLDVNSVKDVKGDDFQIESIGGKRFKVILNYEQRVHVFFNIDVVAMFNHQIEVGPE